MKIISYQFSGHSDVILNDFDYIFIQRCPGPFYDFLKSIHLKGYYTEYIKNFAEKGLCIVSKEPIEVETYKFKNYAGNNPNQGKHYQITYIDGIKFINAGISSRCRIKVINAGISFPDKIIPLEIYTSQVSEVMDLVDDNTILLGDFHNKDCDFPDELNLDKRNLMNHVHSNTYQQIKHDSHMHISIDVQELWLDSLDKIITTKKCPFIIEGVKVLEHKSTNERIHFPVSFYVR